MKVIKETEKRPAHFIDLHIGDTFLFCEEPFIKTCTYDIGTIDNFINAVRLYDGKMYGFDIWDEVEPVDAELIIKA